MIASRPAVNRWIPALSGYRALAALSVFFFHLVSIDPPDGALGRWTVPLGNAAVCLFFVLSGFLIYRPFARWAFGVGPSIGTVQFIVRRAARILPLYWVVLTVHLFVWNANQERTIGELLTAYGLVQNFRGVLVFLPPFVAWSLCIELWFSVALPFLAGPIRQLGSNRRPRTILAIQFASFVAMAAVALVFREWALQAPTSGRLLWVPGYLDWFAGGLALATWLTYRQEVIPDKPALATPNPALGAAIAVTSYWAVTQLGLPNGFETPSRIQSHAQFLLELVAAVSLVTIAVWPGVSLGFPGRLLSSRLLGWLGALSYGVYLAHPMVIDQIEESWPNASLWVVGVAALAVTLVVAQLLHVLVEKPASRLVDRGIGRFNQAKEKLESDEPSEEPISAARRITAATVKWVSTPTATWALLAATASAFLIPFLHQQGKYVGDARYELFADPTSRLTRIFLAWDPTRDLGRPAEEVWPGVTLFASALSTLGFEPWVVERFWHGTLLALALLGAYKLASELVPTRRVSAVIAGVLYAFGPFSAVYLIPSTLYANHMVAPWLVLAVVRASRRRSPLAWACVVALIVFAVGNADPPGLVFAAIPAISCLLGLFVLRPASRKPLLAFGSLSLILTALTSATMITKTIAGADALGQRLLETEPAVAVASSSSFTESVRGMGFWLLYFRLEPSVSRIHQIPLVENLQMMLFSLVPLVAGLLLIAVRLRQLSPKPNSNLSPKVDRLRKPTLAPLALAASWFVLGTVTMVGPYPTDNPSRWGRFLLALYEESDVAFGFRSTHKAGVISALGVALLGGWALGEFARRRPDKHRGDIRWSSVTLVCLLLAGITQPFWRTSLYSPTLTNEEVPQYWAEVGDWFEANPPQGRVLVLPGSTNNGYRWGSVGDDILDPLIPNRLVASTLPLSTPIAAGVTDALDRHLTSSDYQPGDFSSLAQRFGISHVVIRNDLDWPTQGLASPRDLDNLRTDRELIPVGTFGPSDSIEVFAVLNSESATTSVLPANENRRQILVEGDGDATMRLSSTGLLRGHHPVRYASTVATSEMIKVAGDTALVVVADTKLDRDRRITYYGYNYALPATTSDPKDRLRSTSRESVTVVETGGATISANLDRWTSGTDNPPTAAIDGNRNTSWLIPSLAEPVGTVWTVDLPEQRNVTELSVDLYDPAGRIREVDLKINGTSAEFDMADGMITVNVWSKVDQISIEITDLGPGSSSIGIREVDFGEATPLAIASLPTRVAQLASDNSAIASKLAEAELLISIGHPGFSSEPLDRKVKLWRTDDFAIEARVKTDVTEPYCSLDLVRIGGLQIPVKVEPDLNGFGRLDFCEERQQIRMSAGSYIISVTPDAFTTFSELRLTTMDELLPPLTISTIDLQDPELELDKGDLVLTPASFDTGWLLGEPGAANPMALNGLSGFEIVEPQRVGSVRYQAEGPLTLSLWITGLGILSCFAILAGSALRRQRQTDELGNKPGAVATHPFTALTTRVPAITGLTTSVLASPKVPTLAHMPVGLTGSTKQTERNRPGLLVMVAACVATWLAFGWISAATVGLIAVVAMLFGARRLWLVIAAGAVALVSDLFLHVSETVSVDTVSQVAVAVVGGVIAASVHRWKTPTPIAADAGQPQLRAGSGGNEPAELGVGTSAAAERSGDSPASRVQLEPDDDEQTPRFDESSQDNDRAQPVPTSAANLETDDVETTPGDRNVEQAEPAELVEQKPAPDASGDVATSDAASSVADSNPARDTNQQLEPVEASNPSENADEPSEDTTEPPEPVDVLVVAADVGAPTGLEDPELLAELAADDVDDAVPSENLPGPRYREDPFQRWVVPGVDGADLET